MTREQALERAIAAHQQGDLSQSERLCRQIIEQYPDEGRALYLLAVIAARTRRTPDALDVLAKVFAVDPRGAEAHAHLGDVFRNLGQLTEALDSYQRALALNPATPAVLDRQGKILHALGHLNDALRSFDRALAIDPGFVEALNDRAHVLTAMNRHAEALACYDRILAIHPNDVGALNNRGTALRIVKRDAEALHEFQRALAIAPESPDTLYNLGGALGALRRPEEAVDVYARALAFRPDDAPTLNNLGGVLRDLDRPAEALQNFDAALRFRPDHEETLYNRALALSDLRRYGDALQCYARLLQINPTHANARYNRSLCYLVIGDFAHGWPEYEWRWQNEQFAGARRDFSAPRWLGQASLDGKSIVLHGEQGLGDTLMFCRYAKRVAALGANVVLEVQPALALLLNDFDAAIRVISRGEALPACDFHCPLLSLPLAFKTNARTIPQDIPYLRSDAIRTGYWTQRLGDRSKPRVGIVWSGAAANTHDRHRSLTLQQFLPLFPASVQGISLQKEVRDVDAGFLASRADIVHAGDELVDFVDTAALIASTDMVITVDTSVAHLAAAMGRTVWILLSYNADWRWLLDRDDSPWYPTVRLFRQPSMGDWASVVGEVRRELTSIFGA